MIGRPMFRFLKQFLIPKKNLYSISTGLVGDKDETSLVHKLSNEFSDVSYIIDDLKNNELKNVDFDEWRTRINFLKSFDFSDRKCFQMISRCPSILKIPQDDLENTVRQWFGCDFETAKLCNVLFLQPVLLHVDVKSIEKRIPQLRLNFRNSEALAILLEHSPNVMFDNWQNVQEKLHYMKNEGFNMGNILHSNALSCSLDFIKLRLEVLQKCGVFKTPELKPHKKNKYEKSAHVNPLLTDILLQDDQNFAVKVAKITLEEYVTYEKLFQTYKEDDADDNVDDDDDSFP